MCPNDWLVEYGGDVWLEPGGEGRFEGKLRLGPSIPCLLDSVSVGFLEALAK